MSGVGVFRDAIILAPCPRCGARGGDHCVTSSGRTTVQAHSARWESAMKAWHIGYVEGMADALRDPDRACAYLDAEGVTP